MGRFDPSKSVTARFPTVAATWHPDKNPGWTPENTGSNSGYKAWWRCPQGHEWQQTVNSRTQLPEYKCGDVAACPECSRPEEEQRVAHRYPCGHTVVVMRRAAERGHEQCYDCHLNHPRPTTKRRYPKRDIPLSDEQRTAQRTFVGLLRQFMADETGLLLWRDPNNQPWSSAAGAEQLAQQLAVLDVPCMITVTAVCRAPWQGKKSRPQQWHKLRVSWPDVPALEHWLPALTARLAGIDRAALPAPPPVTLRTMKQSGRTSWWLADEQIIAVNPDEATR